MSNDTYITRTIEPVLQQAAREFPAVILTGPRQSGKTTTLKRLFAGDFGYVSLDAADTRAAAVTEPRTFLADHPAPLIVDEVQHAPELLSYIKERIDADRSRAGQYILSGSQNLLLLQQVSETLAGRTAVLRLLPLAFREMAGQPQRPLVFEAESAGATRRTDTSARPAQSQPAPPLSYSDLWAAMLRGTFPELAAHPQRDAASWYGGYVRTYLERDVRTVRQVGDLVTFQAFMRALAARSGQLLNLSELARDLGIAVNSVKAWLSVLEASHQVIILRPYFANVGKQLAKAPKVYLTDVGLLCYLVGLRDAAHAAAGPLAGGIFETAVVSEVVKTLAHRGDGGVWAWFWRTRAGTEVDLIVQHGTRLVPIEAKTSATLFARTARSVAAFRADLGDQAEPGYVVHPGDSRLPLAEGVRALPFAEL